ncbi:MAG: UDP-N-acetylmuramoyl-L-alanine--D-glutamate ligase [Betaproteobacteria bacterium]|nr:UDP-N-acetylmuramoyl-L-alanine--D-glutamate ligase [Betaproteobacteria bacterium]
MHVAIQQVSAKPARRPSAVRRTAGSKPVLDSKAWTPPFVVPPADFAWSGARVGVVGLGDSGLAMARWLVDQGAEVRICDSRAAPPRLAEWQREHPQAYFSGGTFELRDSDWLDGLDCLAWSPGLSPYLGPSAALATLVQERAIPVVGEIELFCRAIAQEPEAPRVIAITGTNGKTTTSCLLAHLLAAAGTQVALAGNVGPPALEVLLERRRAGAPAAVWVLELSSFQLEFAPSLTPHAATILNLSEDHLDWHPDLQAYGAAKQQIFAHAGTCVWNRDDPVTAPLSLGSGRDDRVMVSFGLDAPSRLGDFGIVWDCGLPWLAESVAADVSLHRRPVAAGKRAVRVNSLMPADALRIRGRHNHANALAALALGRAAGVPMARLLHGLRDYAGEPHRCESVAVIDDVEYVDDSKGTNVGATVAALNGLGAIDDQALGKTSANRAAAPRLWLIAGGDGKGQSFEPLAQPVARHARAVLLIGQDATRLRAALATTGVELIDCATLEQAVQTAAERARTGDVVLLSPACASFGMFRNYLHRSETFVAAVQQVALQRGQPC